MGSISDQASRAEAARLEVHAKVMDQATRLTVGQFADAVQAATGGRSALAGLIGQSAFSGLIANLGKMPEPALKLRTAASLTSETNRLLREQGQAQETENKALRGLVEKLLAEQQAVRTEQEAARGEMIATRRRERVAVILAVISCVATVVATVVAILALMVG